MAGDVFDLIFNSVLILSGLATLAWRLVQMARATRHSQTREKTHIAWGSFTYHSERENVEGRQVEKREDYRGYVITWTEPPLTSNRWTANVASDSANLLEAIGGLIVVSGATRDDAVRNARKIIDGVTKS